MRAKENPGFPRFRGKERYDSFTLKQTGWKLDGRNLTIAGLGRFRLFLSRPVEGNIKTVTVRHTATGEWFVSFSCGNVPACVLPEAVKPEVGLDVGINSFLTDSEGNKKENPKFFRESEKELRRKQRSLVRKQRGSRRRAEAKRQVAKTHQKVGNKRIDFLNKLALLYLTTYQIVYIESLNIREMVKSGHLSKSISDVAWGMFFGILCVKAASAGREVIAVAPHNTSQTCSRCGTLVPKALSVRIHRCPSCGLVLDRDENAALNIVVRGRAGRAGVKHGVACACPRIPRL